MNQVEKAKHFHKLHVKGAPLILFNAWDAGSAKAILASGAKAIATSSWSVAEANGFRDGESIPLPFVEDNTQRIVRAISAPVTVDFEGGYSEDDAVLAQNVARLLDLGIVGLNFEDRVVQGEGLYQAGRQARRIEAIRAVALKKQIDLFINARTDTFFADGDPAGFIDGALERAAVYASAGASGFFVPGLRNETLIKRLCDAVSLPLNVMVMEGVPANRRLAELGVARISYGNIPYVEALKGLRSLAEQALK